MGGLFSSEEPKQPTRTSSYRQPTTFVAPDNSYSYQNRTPNRTNYPTQPQFVRNTQQFSRATDIYDYDINEVERTLRYLHVGGRQSGRQVESPQRSTRNLQLFNFMDSYGYLSNIVTYFTLQPCDEEYLVILRKITNKKNFKVDSIEKVINPYLENAYQLKKEQKRKDFPNVEERLLFHGTKKAHIDAICKKNFNWRLCQTHKYGKGISFSPNSTYASVYSDENVYNKVMLVAKVMIGRSCIGNANMILPPSGCDTSQKGVDGIVIVKYEDNEFYPVYKINYHVKNENVGKRPGYKNRGGAFNKNRPSNSYSDFDFDKLYGISHHSNYISNHDYYDDDY